MQLIWKLQTLEMKKIYMAPMEGVTDSIYRNSFAKYYGGVDKFFTPFLSPNETQKFTTREWKEIDPEKNDVSTTVPQLLTNKSEHFLWAANEIAALGYKEINLNLGCPSGTVVAKKKGSGLLYYPEELDRFLYEIYEGVANSGVKKSIKTRLGKVDPEDFYEILDIYNKYPVSELTVHPRVQKDFYKEPIRIEYFDYAYEHSKSPLVFNGEINTAEDIENCLNKYPNINAVMLGRGLIANPQLGSLQQEDFDNKRFKEFHDSLLTKYIDVLSGEKPVLHRMKEFWIYWQQRYLDNPKAIKKIKKANRIADYKSAVNELL